MTAARLLLWQSREEHKNEDLTQVKGRDAYIHTHIYIYIYIYICIYIYIQVSQEECARLREGVPYVKVY